MRDSAAPAGNAGFTLVEALVSLFVFALIAAGSTTLLIQAAQAQRQAAAAHEALRGLQVARAHLSADLSQMAPRAPRSSQDEAPRPRFMGGDETIGLGFVRATMGAQTGAGNGLAYIEYGIEGDRLIRRVRTDLLSPAARRDSDEVVLSGASDLRFQFFDGITWHDQWIAVERGAPRAVALSGTVPRYGAVRIEILTAETW